MIIINDKDKCKCGAYWCGNGYCCNGHRRVLWRVTLQTNLGEDAEECAIEMQKLIEGKAVLKEIIRWMD